MAELKRTFTGGKMDKDTDERIVQNGLYREALNISVATSEDSDVGAAQNILGNIRVTEAIQSTSSIPNLDNKYAADNYHVGAIVDPQTDMLYRFVHTASPVKYELISNWGLLSLLVSTVKRKTIFMLL